MRFVRCKPGHPRTKRLSSLTGLEVKQFFSTSGRGRSIFLDIPLYRSGVCAQNRIVSAKAILRQQPTIPTSPLAWLYFQLVRAVNIFGGASRSLA